MAPCALLCLCSLQLALSVLVIVLARFTLHSEELGCLLAPAEEWADACTYADVVASVSMLFTFLTSLMQLYFTHKQLARSSSSSSGGRFTPPPPAGANSKRLCGIPPRAIQYTVLLLAFAWWVAAAAVLTHYGLRADTAGMPQSDMRAVVIAACWASAALFMAVLGLELWQHKRARRQALRSSNNSISNNTGVSMAYLQHQQQQTGGAFAGYPRSTSSSSPYSVGVVGTPGGVAGGMVVGIPVLPPAPATEWQQWSPAAAAAAAGDDGGSAGGLPVQGTPPGGGTVVEGTPASPHLQLQGSSSSTLQLQGSASSTLRLQGSTSSTLNLQCSASSTATASSRAQMQQQHSGTVLSETPESPFSSGLSTAHAAAAAASSAAAAAGGAHSTPTTLASPSASLSVPLPSSSWPAATATSTAGGAVAASPRLTLSGPLMPPAATPLQSGVRYATVTESDLLPLHTPGTQRSGGSSYHTHTNLSSAGVYINGRDMASIMSGRGVGTTRSATSFSSSSSQGQQSVQRSRSAATTRSRDNNASAQPLAAAAASLSQQLRQSQQSVAASSPPPPPAAAAAAANVAADTDAAPAPPPQEETGSAKSVPQAPEGALESRS